MPSFKHISVSDALAMIQQPHTVVVDVRDLKSYEQGHITDAIHLDNEKLPDFLRDTEYEHPIVVCCYHGNMSQSAAQFLIDQGFDDVYSLDGGFAEWHTAHPHHITTR